MDTKIGECLCLGLWELPRVLLAQGVDQDAVKEIGQLLRKLASTEKGSSWQCQALASSLLRNIGEDGLPTAEIAIRGWLSQLKSSPPSDTLPQLLGYDDITSECRQYLLERVHDEPRITLEILQHVSDEAKQGVEESCIDHCLIALEDAQNLCVLCNKSSEWHTCHLLTVVSLGHIKFTCDTLVRLLKLCWKKTIICEDLWLALLIRGRGQPDLLTEAEQCAAEIAEVAQDLANSELVLWTIRKQQHWLYYSIAVYSKHLLSGTLPSFPEMKHLFLPLVMYTWENTASRLQIYPFLHQLWKDQDLADNVIYKSVVHEMAHQVNVVKWCLDNSSSRHIADLFHLIQLESPSILAMINRVVNLATCDWPKVLELLSGQVRSFNSSPYHLADVALFRGYCVVVKALQAIAAAVEIYHQLESFRNGGREYDFQSLYEQNVLSILQWIKKEVPFLHPVTLRLEVLESLFCLLFLRQGDWYEEDSSDSGGNGDTETGRKSCFIGSTRCSPLLIDASGHQIFESSLPHRKKRRKPSSLSGSGTVSGASDGTSRSRHSGSGFLCGPYITRDLLLILKQCLEDIQPTYEPSYERERLPLRLSLTHADIRQRLMQMCREVGEAKWRLELVTEETFPIGFGELNPRVPPLAKLELFRMQSWCNLEGEFSDEESGDLFQRSHFNKDPKKNGDMIKSSESEAALSSSSCRRRRNLSGKTVLSETIPSNQRGVIALMLGSPASLAALCLHRGRLVRVEQVVQTFGMEGTVADEERHFAPAYAACVAQMNALPTEEFSGIEPRMENKQRHINIKSIHEVAAAAVNSSSPTALSERLLTQYKAPSIDLDRSSVSHVINMSALVTLDLALTTGSNLENSSVLVEKAFQMWPSLHQETNSEIAGIDFIQRIRAVCAEYKRVASAREDKTLLPVGIALCEILCTNFPLQLKILRHETRYLSTLQSILDDLHETMLQLHNSNGKVASQAGLKVHGLLRNLTEQQLGALYARKRLTKNGPTYDYVSSFHSYIRHLSATKQKYMPAGDAFCSLDILQNTLIKLVRQMIFENGVNPHYIEPVMTRLRLNLPLLLCRAASKFVPPAYGMELVSQSFPDKTDKTSTSPLIVVKAVLLGELNVSKMSNIDLNLLCAYEERLAFFLNVAALIRSNLPHDEEYSTHIEKIVDRYSCGFQIGQLGFVTLYDMQQAFLTGKTLGVFSPSRDIQAFLLIFCPMEYLPVFNPEAVEFQKEEALAQWLCSTVKLSGEQLSLPSVFVHHWHSIVNDSIALEELSPVYHWMWNDTVTVTDQAITDVFSRLVVLTGGQLNEELKPLVPLQQLILSPCDKSPIPFILSPSITAVESAVSPPIPALILDFLQEHCWILVPFIKLFTGHQTQNSSSRSTFGHLTLQMLLESDIATMWPSASLFYSFAFTLSYIWQHLQSLTEQHLWQKAIHLLQQLPSPILDSDRKLQFLCDFLLAHVALQSQNENGEDLPNWVLCAQIKNVSLKTQIVLHLSKSWPGKVAMTMIQELLDEVEISSVQDQLKEYLSIIQLCHEVSTARNFVSWQQVYHCGFVEVLYDLTAANEFRLGLKWAVHNHVERDNRMDTDLQYMRQVLSQEPTDTTEAIAHLDSLSEDHALELCKRLLNILVHTSEQSVVLNHILSKCSSLLSQTEHSDLLNFQFGINLLEFLPQNLRGQCSSLVQQPLLIFEQLLLSMRVDGVKLLKPHLNDHSHLSDLDELVITYATKALECQFIQNSKDVSSSEAGTLSALSDEQMSFATQSVSDISVFVVPTSPPSRENWIPDDQETSCMRCRSVQFSMFFNRRHHCRRCGRVVCGTCSPHRMKVKGYGNVNVRTCIDCFTTDPSQLPARDPYGIDALTDILVAGGLSSWQLTLDDMENEVVRREFSYECAPSAALCLAILSCHSQQKRVGKFLLDEVEKFISLLAKSNSESDPQLLLATAGALIKAAKLTFSQGGDAIGDEADCDTLEWHLQLAALFVKSGRINLMQPLSGITCKKSGWGEQLCIHLVAAEEWPLALEVAAKVGTDVEAVWASWGKACLRTGDWVGAREKFHRCFSRITGTTSSMQPSVLVSEIVTIICQLQWPLQSDTASYLQSIIDNGFGCTEETPNNPKTSSASHVSVHPELIDECLYYLTVYGDCALTLSFLVGVGKIGCALELCRMTKVEPEIVAEVVCVTALQKGWGEILKDALLSTDPTLAQWKGVMICLCRHIEHNGWWHCLLDMQLFTGDLIRAAMTCVHFFTHPPVRTYQHLHSRLTWIVQAKQQLSDYLATNSALRTKNNTPHVAQLPLLLPTQEVSRHALALQRQEEVTKFLNACEESGIENRQATFWIVRLKLNSVPTLLESESERRATAILCLLCGANVEEGFGLSFRIIEEWHLGATKVFSHAGCLLAENDMSMGNSRGKSSTEQLIQCILSSGLPNAQEITDEVVTSVAVSTSGGKPAPLYDKLMALMRDPKMKVEAYIGCRKLKSAYLIAVRNSWAWEVRRIQQEASKSGQNQVVELCNRWLQHRSTKDT